MSIMSIIEIKNLHFRILITESAVPFELRVVEVERPAFQFRIFRIQILPIMSSWNLKSKHPEFWLSGPLLSNSLGLGGGEKT